MKLPIHRTLAARLTGLFALLLMLFTLLLGLIFNAIDGTTKWLRITAGPCSATRMPFRRIFRK